MLASVASFVNSSVVNDLLYFKNCLFLFLSKQTEYPEDYVFMPHAASRDNAMKLLARQFEIVLEVTDLKLSTAGETRTL